MTEKQYLVDDLNLKEAWRIFHIMAEFVEGFNVMPEVHPAVTIFGSSRTKAQSSIYKTTVKTARLLAENNFNVISGGGPGIMEAANKGAAEGGAKSVGPIFNFPMNSNPTHIPMSAWNSNISS